MSAELTTVRIEDLHVPTIRKDGDDVEALARSMGHHGQRDPIVVVADPAPRVISGTRRIRAARMLGWVVVDAVIVSTMVEVADVMADERGDARRPTTPTEKARQALAMRGLPLGVEPDVVASQGGTATTFHSLAGKAIGVHPAAVRALLLTWDLSANPAASRDERQAAADTLKVMDRSGSIDPPYRALSQKIGGFKRGRSPVIAGVGAAEARARSRFKSVAEQRYALTRLVSTVQNLAVAVDYVGDINPEMPVDERQACAQELSRARTTLTQLINALKKA